MGAPSVPGAGKTANKALNFGKKAGVMQNRLNQMNQQTPYGSLKYVQTGKKHGIPQWTAKTKLSDPQKQLLQGQEQLGLSSMGAGQNILDQNDWSQGPDMSANGLQERVMGWGDSYYKPILDQQTRELEAKLRSQGIAPGNAAYNDAMNLDARNRGDVYTNLLMKGTDQAMRAAESEYFDPLKAYQALTQGQGPGQNQFVQTPQAGVAAPDYGNLAYKQYANESENYGNMMGGLFSIPKNILGGWASGGLE